MSFLCAMSARDQPSLGKPPTRLLLAEGDQTSLTHLQQLLSRMGYDIIVAKDGLEALETLQSSDAPALAVLDWTMPGLNGTDVCRGLRQGFRGKSTYVILLSDWKQQKDRVDALEAGADDCLYKPVDVRELRVRLQIGSQTILERALRESEERLRGAFEYAGTGMALAKITGEFLQVNPALSDFLGYSQQELMAMGVHAIGHPDNRPSSSDLLAQFLKSGRRSEEFERKFLTKNGAVAWTLITLSTVLDLDQHTTGFFVQFNDITQRKAAEDALRRSEALFRAIMNNMNDLITVRDLHGQCRYASPSYARHLGYAPQELLGTNLPAILHPDDLAAVEDIVASLRNGQPPEAHTFRYRHKNGTPLHVESSISLLRESDGAPEGLLAVSRVVEDRIQAELKLQAAYSETELFLQSIPSILIGLDGAGRITRWNPTAAEAFGISGRQVMGRRIDDCGIQWSQPQINLEVNRWLQAETACRSELRFERDGRARFIGLHVRHLPASEPGPPRLLVTGADVTERKGLEEQLRQAQKLEAIGQLAAGVAHEINTPTQYVGDNTRFLRDSWAALAGLLELSRTMRQQAESSTVSRELLTQFDQLAEQADMDYLLKEIPAAIAQSLDGVQRVAKIVQGMKEFSHPGSEEKRAIDINKAIETTITVARHEWKYVADVVTHFDQTLPLIPCLIGEFNQVILNLIINAAQAIATAVENGSTEKGTITITTSHDSQWAEIAVQDTGMGIPEQIRSRIFEPFFTTKALGKGTGQGLTLAHSAIVNRHQGQIFFQTEMGKGSTFFIRLPLVPVAPPL
jgi:PAS domain S-box-containing protein